MGMPAVAIVGRPNVGKSSMFNWLAGRRISIVDPTAGVTRDRVGVPLKVGDRFVELIDTGGMGVEDVDNLTADVEGQIDLALAQADVILFVVDARAGRVPLDDEVASRLRAVTRPVICVVNKCDAPEMDALAADFYALGYEPLVCVSAEQKRGQAELSRVIGQSLPEEGKEIVPAEVAMKLAIVGRRNAGKSTFINQLAQGERVIVSEVPGTTRDSIDVRFERDGKAFIAIDTAGVRKKKSIANDIEFYSTARAERSIRRADVALHFFDGREPVSRVDKQLTEYVLENHKPVVFVVNKWDLVKDQASTEEFATYLKATFPMLDYVPIAFVTAKSGRNVYKLLNLTQSLHKQSTQRVSTGVLNQLVREATERRSPPMRFNRNPRILYATQAAVKPPTLIMFTNGPELFDQTYQRYLLNFLRERLPFNEIPVKMILRPKYGGGPADAPGQSEVIEETRVEAARPAPPQKPRREEPQADVWRDL